jgi:CheY-like chemotaxis protein
MVGANTNQQAHGILLIDDDAISREVLSMMLELHGFQVLSSEDGAEALRIASAAAPEVILMDTQMPGLSGVELIQALRQCCGTRSKVRIIAISGSDVGEEIKMASDGFLLKPIQVESLVALLEAKDVTEETHGVVAEVSASSEPIDAVETADLIDPIVLGKLKAMMPANAVIEIYSAVAADLETRLDTLNTAMDSRNQAEVQRIAHAIKGGCAMVGLSSATSAASRLETSNLSETWPKELLQLHFALSKLQGILGDGLL